MSGSEVNNNPAAEPCQKTFIETPTPQDLAEMLQATKSAIFVTIQTCIDQVRTVHQKAKDLKGLKPSALLLRQHEVDALHKIQRPLLELQEALELSPSYRPMSISHFFGDAPETAYYVEWSAGEILDLLAPSNSLSESQLVEIYFTNKSREAIRNFLKASM